MAVQEVIDRAMFDEALRIGNQSVTQANHQMRISRIAVDAIHQALELIKTGRVTEARDRLDKALLVVTKMSRPREV
jgi:hypothetical protein